MVTLTVLMGVWNAPVEQLAQAVESVLGQTFGHFEFLILDDGSTNADTLAYLEQCRLRDPRVRVVHEPHHGLTVALNRGIQLAHGEWIARQDADDWSEPERLATQWNALRQRPGAVLAGSNAWTHQENGLRLWRTHLPGEGPEISRALPKGNPFVHGATMYRRSVALKLGGYSAAFRCSQDYDFFWRMSEAGEVFNLAEPLYHYRYSAGSISAGKAAEQAIAHRAAHLLAEARGRGEALAPSTAIAEARAAGSGDPYRALLKQADHMMLAGSYGRAARAYCGLLARHPLRLLAWGKLARLGVFATLPLAREACFR